MCYTAVQFCCFGLGCLNKLSFEVSAGKVPFQSSFPHKVYVCFYSYSHYNY